MKLRHIGDLSSVKAKDTKSVFNLKCLVVPCDHETGDKTGNCCVGTDRHSQPNAYMETNLNRNRVDDVSKEKPDGDVRYSTQPEYCYIDIDDMDGERRPSTSVYEEIDYCQSCASTIDDIRCYHRDTLFDNDDVLELMENDIYGSSKDQNDGNVEIVENDVYNRSENESDHCADIIEYNIYGSSEDQNDGAVEIVENNIYDTSKDGSDHSVEIIDNDIYDRSENKSDNSVEIIDNDMYDSLSNIDSDTAAAGVVVNHVYEEVDIDTKEELRIIMKS